MAEQVTWIHADDRNGTATLDFVAERDGQRNVTGALWLPAVVNPDVPLLVLGHGASGDRYQDPLPELARRFTAELGGPALAMDGPVHGLRRVEPGGRAALAVDRQRPTALTDVVEEWHFAIDLALGHEAVGPRPLAYFGLSMGSLFGMPMIAERNDVVVSTLGLLGVEGLFSDAKQALLEAAVKITHPVLFLMQLEDELFSRDGYLELFDAIGSDNKRLHANPGLHPLVPTEEVLFAFEFLQAHIQGTAPSGVMAAISD